MSTKIAIQVPIKGQPSVRLPGKNFIDLAGKPMCRWLLDELDNNVPQGWDIWIDTEDIAVWNKLERHYPRFHLHKRAPELAEPHVTSSPLMYTFAALRPDYDIYAFTHCTSPTLPGGVLVDAIERLVDSEQYDSVVMVQRCSGRFWYGGQPINHDPHRMDGRANTQDCQVLQETSGLYAIRREKLIVKGTHIGDKPYFYEVPQRFAVDVDTQEDLELAELLINKE